MGISSVRPADINSQPRILPGGILPPCMGIQSKLPLWMSIQSKLLPESGHENCVWNSQTN